MEEGREGGLGTTARSASSDIRFYKERAGILEGSRGGWTTTVWCGDGGGARSLLAPGRALLLPPRPPLSPPLFDDEGGININYVSKGRLRLRTGYTSSRCTSPGLTSPGVCGHVFATCFLIDRRYGWFVPAVPTWERRALSSGLIVFRPGGDSNFCRCAFSLVARRCTGIFCRSRLFLRERKA